MRISISQKKASRRSKFFGDIWLKTVPTGRANLRAAHHRSVLVPPSVPLDRRPLLHTSYVRLQKTREISLVCGRVRKHLKARFWAKICGRRHLDPITPFLREKRTLQKTLSLSLLACFAFLTKFATIASAHFLIRRDEWC